MAYSLGKGVPLLLRVRRRTEHIRIIGVLETSTGFLKTQTNTTENHDTSDSDVTLVSLLLKSPELDYLFNRLFRMTPKKTSMLCITGPLRGESNAGRWIPLDNAKSVSIFMMSHDFCCGAHVCLCFKNKLNMESGPHTGCRVWTKWHLHLWRRMSLGNWLQLRQHDGCRWPYIHREPEHLQPACWPTDSLKSHHIRVNPFDISERWMVQSGKTHWIKN